MMNSVNEQYNRHRVLLVGPLPLEGEALGGAKTAFLKTVDSLKKSNNFSISVLSTSRRISSASPIVTLLLNAMTTLKLLLVFVLIVFRYKTVVINMSSGGALATGWIYVLLANLFRKKVVLRVFGGSFYDKLVTLSFARKYLADYMLASVDLLVLETKNLCQRFSFLRSVHWLPNCRDLPAVHEERKEIRTVLFLSHIRKDKGVLELLNASENFPDSVSVLFYGAIDFDIDETLFDEYSRARYMGRAGREDVPSILANADIVVLPTYYAGEGYPGTIIEALQSGIPVVATRWRAIPEVIEDNVNGLLVDPGSVEQLQVAIMSLISNPRSYQAMSIAARRRGECFDCTSVHLEFSKKIQALSE